MANKPKRRRDAAKFRAIRFQFNVSLGTLANGVMLSTSIGAGVGNEYYAISLDAQVVLTNVTPFTGGPLAFGWCHSDYSVQELDEWYEATNTLTGDKIEQEEGRRQARDGGIMMAGPADASAAIQQNWNDGRTKRFRLNMRIEDTKSVNVWVRNMGASAYATTVPVFRGYGKLYLKLS